MPRIIVRRHGAAASAPRANIRQDRAVNDLPTVDRRHDRRTVRVARVGVISTLVAGTLLCVIGVTYILAPPSRPWGAGAAIALVTAGIAGELAMRRTWRHVEGRDRVAPRRERLCLAADVAGMSASRAAMIDRWTTLVWLIIVVVAFITVRST